MERHAIEAEQTVRPLMQMSDMPVTMMRGMGPIWVLVIVLGTAAFIKYCGPNRTQGRHLPWLLGLAVNQADPRFLRVREMATKLDHVA